MRVTVENIHAIRGAATTGTETTLQDVSKDFATDVIKNKLLLIRKDGKEYLRTITAHTADTLTFASLGEGKQSGTLLGSGAPPEGQVTIEVIPIASKVKFVAGEGTEQSPKAEQVTDAEGVTTLVFTSGTDENDEPVAILPTALQSLIEAETDYLAGRYTINAGEAETLPVEAEANFELDDCVIYEEGDDPAYVTITRLHPVVNAAFAFFVGGVEPSVAATTEYHEAENVVRVLCGTDEDSEPVPILPANLQTLLEANEDLAKRFKVTVVDVDALPVVTTYIYPDEDGEYTIGAATEQVGQVKIESKDKNAKYNGVKCWLSTPGEENMDTIKVNWDASMYALVIDSKTDAEGKAIDYTASEIATAINSDEIVSELFEATEVIEGTLSQVTTPEQVVFSGGKDPITGENAQYVVLL